MKSDLNGTPILTGQFLTGQSGASVLRFEGPDHESWIEKSGSPVELAREVVALEWCFERGLPVPRLLSSDPESIRMSLLPGVDLSEVLMQEAVPVMVQAFTLLHSISTTGCPLDASWDTRLRQGEANIAAGQVDESDLDEENFGRSPLDILEELRAMPPLPDLRCFTHGDACLPNFLSLDGKLSGIVDLGRAGVTHPAQDWALALRSVGDNFGPAGERLLLEHIPAHSRDDSLLRRFRLLDELF